MREIFVSKTAMETTAGERLRRVLTWSEREVLRALLEHLGDRNEAVIVVGSIADRLYVTRGVIAHALRIAEAAGVLISKSSGQRGTYVRVTDRESLQEAIQ